MFMTTTANPWSKCLQWSLRQHLLGNDGVLDAKLEGQPKKFTEEESRETGAIKVSIYREYLETSGGVWFWDSNPATLRHLPSNASRAGMVGQPLDSLLRDTRVTEQFFSPKTKPSILMDRTPLQGIRYAKPR